MKVEVRHGQKNLCHSNVIWSGQWPMRNGKFPADHPVASGDKFALDMGTSESIAKFRARGYWASCFPEGDGIVFSPPEGKTHEQVEQDVRECFGFEVVPRG